MYKLRPHQIEKSKELALLLKNKNVAYLAGEDLYIKYNLTIFTS